MIPTSLRELLFCTFFLDPKDAHVHEHVHDNVNVDVYVDLDVHVLVYVGGL